MATIPTFPTFTAGEVLTADKLEALKIASSFYGNPPQAQARRTAAQAVTPSSNIDIQFQIVDFDNDNIIDLVADNDALTIQTPGYYNIIGMVEWTDAASPTGFRSVSLQKNGTDFAKSLCGGFASGLMSLSVPGVEACNSGDKISLYFNHGQGASMNTANNAGGTRLYVRWVGEL